MADHWIELTVRCEWDDGTHGADYALDWVTDVLPAQIKQPRLHRRAGFHTRQERTGTMTETQADKAQRALVDLADKLDSATDGYVDPVTRATAADLLRAFAASRRPARGAGTIEVGGSR